MKINCNQIMSKWKRKRGVTPKTSPKRKKDNEPKRLKLESILKLITKEDGIVCLESFLALKSDQLRKLSKELKLSLPSKLRKKELRQKISASLKIQSAKITVKGINAPDTSKVHVQRHSWSPPKVLETASLLSPIRIENNYPEKGVRIVRMSEIDKARNVETKAKLKTLLNPVVPKDNPIFLGANSLKTKFVGGGQVSFRGFVDSRKTKSPGDLRQGKVQGFPNNSGQSDELLVLIRNLQEENHSLKLGLKKSEDLRKGMELRIAQMQKKSNIDLLTNILALDTTRAINDCMDQQMGLLWNLSSESDAMRVLDEYLGKLEHSSRCSGEQPLVILSERQLEMVSFPIDEEVKSSIWVMSKALHLKANMIGHMDISQEEVEITAGFAGAKGNLIWFNTGDCDLLLRLKTGKETQSMIIEHGFGFCLGKKEKFTRVFLSSVNRTVDLFSEDEHVAKVPRAMFFGCDNGDNESWLGKLNNNILAAEYKNNDDSLNYRKAAILNESERNKRLGITSINNKRNIIRIAPMRGSNIQPNVLAGKVVEVEKWIKDTLRCVKSRTLPNSFSVIPKKEHPLGGEPFDVLWAKFEFDEKVWDDEVMWDIRYLLMGSKLDKLPGFPTELYDIREKLYVTRDGISERGRKARLD